MNHDDIEAEANEAFYKWEHKLFGDDTPLSDNERNLFVTGYVIAKLNNEGETA
jgi:hypothetical protein